MAVYQPKQNAYMYLQTAPHAPFLEDRHSLRHILPDMEWAGRHLYMWPNMDDMMVGWKNTWFGIGHLLAAYMYSKCVTFAKYDIFLHGHCLRGTHLLLISSMSWPGGQPHPRLHSRVHRRSGSLHVAGHVRQFWITWPSIGHLPLLEPPI